MARSVESLVQAGVVWRLEAATGPHRPLEAVGEAAEPADVMAKADGVHEPLSFSKAAGRFGIPAIDGVLPGGGLAAGATHEWFFSPFADADAARPTRRRSGEWFPPLTLLSVLAGRASLVGEHDPQANDIGCRSTVVWIGQRCWPTPHLLTAVFSDEPETAWWQRCVFVDPPSHKRLWAIVQALRCTEVAAVVADVSGADLAATRRLQLAAEAGGTLGLLARPPAERDRLSAAATRWQVRPCPSPSICPCWHVELSHIKGVQPKARAQREWLIEWSWEPDREPDGLHLPADAEHRWREERPSPQRQSG